MERVEDLLPLLRANRYTYSNLDTDSIAQFKKLYNYLKQHSNKSICILTYREVTRLLKSSNLDYVNKFLGMRIIINNFR